MLKHTGKKHLYTELAELPIPTSASFISSDVIRVAFSKKDHQRDIKRSISKTIFVTGPNTVSSTLAQDISEIQASVVSPSKSRVAILRQISEHDKKKRFVEIWADDRLEASQEVTNIHGAFSTGDVLLSLSFSPSENALLYTAEANEPTTSEANEDVSPYERYRYTPQFGEGYPGQKRPTLYLFRWGTSTELGTESTKLTALSFPKSAGHVLIGQAVFASEDCVFATGFEYTESGRLLGIKYCFNRPTSVWMLHIPEIGLVDTSSTTELALVSRVTSTDHSSRSPRVLPGESTVFWLSNATGGSHSSCTSLYSLNFLTMEKKTVVDSIWEPDADGFPGLYPDFSLPSQPFLKLGSVSYVTTHSVWGSRSTVLLIALNDGRVRDLTPDKDGILYSWMVLGTDGHKQIICGRSSPSIPYEVVLGRVDDAGGVSWQIISQPTLTPEIKENLGTLQASIIPIPNRHPVETILLRTKTPDSSVSAPRPCVFSPHGGPHTTMVTSFSPVYVALALEGYAICLVNYTGSIGFGETYVRKLLGQCGTLDVQDCISSVNHFINIGISESGPGKQFVEGGSHGGFLSAHLVGQYPDVFSAAVIRNPVISCGEISTTDIPDWYFAEFGFPYNSTSIVTPSHYATLYAASPVAHIDKVCAKVLLLMGEVDLRVSPTNSLTYYHALKGRGKPVEMLTFPKDSHPLDGVETSKIAWEAMRDWFDAAQNQRAA